MMAPYLRAYVQHNRSSVLSLAVISFIACAFLGLVIAVTQMLLTDYFVRMEYLGQSPEITGSSISFFVVTAICSIAIVLMLKSAFDVAMHARIRNLGIYKSIGATDAQVRRLLLAEGCVLALPAGCVGVFVGLGSAFLLVSGLVAMTAVNRTYDPVIEIAPAAILTALVASGLTIVISALLPARRLGKLSTIKAISEGDANYERVHKPGAASRLLGRMCGIEARLAADSLRARRRSMRTANISIAFAVLAFMTLLNFETLSHLSTQETYFQRYEGVWDVRVMFEDAARYGVDEGVVSELRALDGVTGVTFGDVYKEDSDDAFYNVLTDSARSARQVTSMLEDRYSGEQGVEVLNLDEEAVRDERSRSGIRLFIDVFAAVLAAIGIADVFASVLGRIPTRRHELAQLVAAGISARQVHRMFTVESLLIIAKPLALAAVLNSAIVVLAVKVSPVEMSAFLANMPLAHIGVFLVASWLPICIAYRLGEREMMRGPVCAAMAD